MRTAARTRIVHPRHTVAQRMMVNAPKVVAKGEGYVAAAIKEKARRHGIPLRRDDDLIELLAQVEIDRQIPPELYAAVAELLSWVYRANEAIKKESCS